MRYQSHSPGEKGMVDSQRRLERLQIPADLRGKSVLDIGCNEGFFCNVAATRGARRVVGLEISESALRTARELYGSAGIEFIRQSWGSLPEGPFDLVIWSSAMHYELDPLSVLRNVSHSLGPDGLFILECGAVSSNSKEMVLVQRWDGSLWYPTRPFLEEYLLDGFAFRQVADAETVGNDPVPRIVYHCRRPRPIVIILRGPTKTGKSSTARALYPAATKVVGLDLFISRMMTADHSHTNLQKYIKAKKTRTNLTEVYDGIDASGLTDEYTSLLQKAVAQTDRVVIIEGYLTDLQTESLRRKLAATALVWEANA
jgi:SAM-dependent methyltransferase